MQLLHVQTSALCNTGHAQDPQPRMQQVLRIYCASNGFSTWVSLSGALFLGGRQTVRRLRELFPDGQATVRSFNIY
jgi:hypothetical protein